MQLSKSLYGTPAVYQTGTVLSAGVMVVTKLASWSSYLLCPDMLSVAHPSVFPSLGRPILWGSACTPSGAGVWLLPECELCRGWA